MKAKAGIFTLLLLLISIGGFGITTADRSQDSEVIAFIDNDVGMVAVLNVENDLMFNEGQSFDLTAYFSLHDALGQNKTFQSNTITQSKQGYVLKPPLIVEVRTNINKELQNTNHNHTSLVYRKARDGISYV